MSDALPVSDEVDLLLVGAGGIGAPAALALGAAGLRSLAVVDDDRVELSNLHRQILFTDRDIGRPKLDAFAEALARRFSGLSITLVPGRVRPENAASLVSRARVVLDATDNFATRFLLADACHLAGVPVVHAAAVRWRATVIAAGSEGRPCYRCLFEDLPEGPAPDCASAGVVGPVCGVAGALAADRALRILAGDRAALGKIATYDGLTDRLREVGVRARPGCPLCGAARSIHDLSASRYLAAACASL
ncbi:MAG: HesA/MoeB/ThiF family protein [Byssovorax sp.]